MSKKGLKNSIVIGIANIIFFPKIIFANEYELVSEEIKYYKTDTYYPNDTEYSTSSTSNIYSVTEEISEEEYDAFDPMELTATINPQASVTIETTYKKLTGQIYSNGSKYRYWADLYWKNIPSTRSYDIIGIGHYTNVDLSGSLHFQTQYCNSSGACSCLTSYTGKTSDGGATATFKLPTGTLTALDTTFYYDVVKDGSGTITSQVAAADYSHATKSITQANASNHSIDSGGIHLNSSISSYYDNISTATATWSGSW